MTVRIKICGLRTPETLEAALVTGADMVGFVFFARSPRHIDLATATQLGAQAAGRADKVALVVDADDASIAAIINALQPDWLQLHGHETPERVAIIRAQFGLPVMKALGISTVDDLASIIAYADSVDALLFDAKPPPNATLPGGNGVAFDWSLLAGLDLAKPFMVSGGLDPFNVGTALDITGAPGVDVSSGVETAPGIKAPDRIAAFVTAVRQHDLRDTPHFKKDQPA